MTADEIRTLLASIKPRMTREHGYLTILRADVEARTTDVASVEQWILSVGGRIEQDPPIRDTGLRADRLAATYHESPVVYLVPAAELQAP